MVDGEVIDAQQEERFKRIKNYDTWPGLAIKSCLNIANLKTEQIDKVIWAGKDPIKMEYFLTKRYSSYSNRDMIKEQYLWWKKIIYENKKIDYLDLFKDKIDKNQSPGKKILSKYLALKKDEKKKEFGKKFKELLIKNELGIDSSKLV